MSRYIRPINRPLPFANPFALSCPAASATIIRQSIRQSISQYQVPLPFAATIRPFMSLHHSPLNRQYHSSLNRQYHVSYSPYPHQLPCSACLNHLRPAIFLADEKSCPAFIVTWDVNLAVSSNRCSSR
jgi:hypothetical protein